jgi:hypothetical protein
MVVLTAANMSKIDLFQSVDFISHAGKPMTWKIECDAISDDEWVTLAKMIREVERRSWSKAVGIPRGGVALGKALDTYSTGNPDHPILIADDVYTTGTSFIEFKAEHYSDVATIEWCVFARKATERRVKALFTMETSGTKHE